jgi:hypothetical protein
MTFDPNRGLVPGNNLENSSNGRDVAPQANYATQTNYPTQLQDPPQDSEKHQKHHHKFLFFGHRQDDSQTDKLSRSKIPSPPAQSEPSQSYGVAPSSTVNWQQNAPFLPKLPSNIPSTMRSKIPAKMPPSTSPNCDIHSFVPSVTPESFAISPSLTPSVTPSVAPPNPPSRPAIPQVDANARLPILQNAGTKPALAWRAKAWRLSQESEGSASAAKHPYRVLQCSQKEAVAAVINSCQMKGGELYGQNATAGHLAVRFNDATGGSTLVIFVFKIVGPNQTVIKASLDTERSQKIAILNELLSQTAVIIDGKGLL